MSRIGKQPIPVPAGVNVQVEPGLVRVNGPKGELSERVPTAMRIEQNDGELTVARPTDRGEHRALHGLTRTLIANMVTGVTDGYEKRLEIQGVELEVPAPTQVVVRGASKQVVGETAARIRKVRPPEPYKGKGIRYEGEYVRKKAGKAAKGAVA